MIVFKQIPLFHLSAFFYMVVDVKSSFSDVYSLSVIYPFSRNLYKIGYKSLQQEHNLQRITPLKASSTNELTGPACLEEIV